MVEENLKRDLTLRAQPLRNESKKKSDFMEKKCCVCDRHSEGEEEKYL